MRTTLRILELFENAVLVVLFAAMLVLAFVQIGIRNCESLLPFATSACSTLQPMLIWGDPLARLLVLWVALWGSMVAARSNRHIRIDAVTRFLPEAFRDGVSRGVNLISAGMCLAVAWYALQFVLEEFEFGGTAATGLPSWIGASIIPLAFLVLGWRLLLAVVWLPAVSEEEAG